jgi:cell wall-associated NlpC family hydrolase
LNPSNESIDVGDLVGVPFRDMGRDTTGYDCWGIGIEVCSRGDNGFKLPDYQDIHRHDIESIRRSISRDESELFEEVLDWNSVAARDVLVFHEVNGVQHFGFMIDRRRFIHTGPEFGVRINKLSSPYARTWVKRILRWRKS